MKNKEDFENWRLFPIFWLLGLALRSEYIAVNVFALADDQGVRKQSQLDSCKGEASFACLKKR
jgi:hypothetical protein